MRLSCRISASIISGRFSLAESSASIIGGRFSLAESCSSVVSIIGGNDDLLIKILVLLPAKSVVRLKSVSKHWSFLISTEYFARLHVQNHGPELTQHSFILNDVHGSPHFFICHPTIKGLVRVNLPRSIEHQSIEHVKIVQSTNGLLLLTMKFLKKDEIDYVVFNPTTKQYRFIPLDGYRPSRICLFFDRSKSEHYTLIMSTSANPRFSVYDSATHQWSHGRDTPFIGDASISGAPLHSHIVCSLILQDTSHNNPNLLGVPELGYVNYMLESNEHLNMLQLKPQGENKCCFRVGDMINNNWTICKEATLDFNSNKVELLGMMREESIDDSVFLFHVPGRFLIYKFSNDQDLEMLIDYRSDYFYVEDQLQFEYASPFIHTFASV